MSVTTTAFGAASIDALARALAQGRSGSVLAPALVLCPTQLVAVGARRDLGRHEGGVAGVTITTIEQFSLDRVAHDLARAGLRPATDLELQAAIRAELSARPGLFGSVADHRTTEERLVELHHQLAGVGPETLEQLEARGVGLAADAIRVVRRAEHRLGTVRSSHALVELALDRLAELPAGALGPIVLFLPEPRRPFDARFIAALSRRSDCEVIVGLTGSSTIDRRHLARLAACSVQVDGVGPALIDPAPNQITVNGATRLEVGDPDDEVRAALQDVVAHAALGVPLSHMAVAYPTVDPYLSLLTDQLDAAGLPWCGPGRRPLAASLCGRFALRILSLAGGGLERGPVMTLVGAAPVLDGAGRIVPASVWDELSRRAGIVDGDQWAPRLDELAGHLDPDGAAAARSMAAFVTELGRLLWPDPMPRSWRGWARWMTETHRSIPRPVRRVAAGRAGGPGPDRGPARSGAGPRRLRRAARSRGLRVDRDHPAPIDERARSATGVTACWWRRSTPWPGCRWSG